MSLDPGDRRARRAAQRADARRVGSASVRPGGTGRSTPGSRWLLPGLIAGALVVAVVLAIVLPGSGDPSGGGSSTVPPSGTAVGTSAGASMAIATPRITGTALPDFDPRSADPAVGRPAPEVEGVDFDGQPVAISADGRPKVMMFFAHWCPHCQDEVPLIQAWVNTGGVPDGVDLVTVATGIDPAAPNYPPDAWLEREGWTSPVIGDSNNSVASAYGLTAFPFWVFVGPDGTVRSRAAGEMTITDLEAAIRGLTTNP